MTGKRAIFEEVGAEQPRNAPPKGGMIDAKPKGARRAIRAWLMVLFALVVVMIAVGGLTRLTDSGLSITEWRPITGAWPPIGAEAWQAEFDKYREIPQYQLQNKGMSLGEFQFIYWWEWGHRQLGRVIGLVWALGFFGFLLTRTIPTGWTMRLLGLGVLGGAQGAIGWWMVTSGLTGTAVFVASYRLAIHLGLAFVILGFIAWYVFQLGRSEAQLMQARRNREARLVSAATVLIAFAAVQILLGALVAGIDAGRSYPDWPLMAGGVFPPEPFGLTPIWRNFFEDPGLVQFMHRTAGYILFLLTLAIWWRARRSPNRATRFGFNAVLAMLSVQMVLGIAAVIYQAPWHIAIVHQFGAVILWVLMLRARHQARYPVAQSVRG
ncbi:heme A synthase [Oceaniglobus ichthyenteri]|uniref:heme A synthase n=1 Tax=Oceaniglobus ichthyenteri TaxID=2136177 RepID=UPI000D3A9DC3|nr:heme A synthase [Oceaniglobus ichthyenteri]